MARCATHSKCASVQFLAASSRERPASGASRRARRGFGGSAPVDFFLEHENLHHREPHFHHVVSHACCKPRVPFALALAPAMRCSTRPSLSRRTICSAHPPLASSRCRLLCPSHPLCPPFPHTGQGGQRLMSTGRRRQARGEGFRAQAPGRRRPGSWAHAELQDVLDTLLQPGGPPL